MTPCALENMSRRIREAVDAQPHGSKDQENAIIGGVLALLVTLVQHAADLEAQRLASRESDR